MEAFNLSASLVLDSSQYTHGLNQSEKQGKTFADKISAKTVAIGQMLGNFATSAVQKTGSIIKQTISESIDAYADYEQLVGGVETLFGAGGRSLEKYIKETGDSSKKNIDAYNRMIEAQEHVMKNADRAYKTAGLSANEYMEMSTSFAASLISSLKGNTLAAADYADMAMQDMADNANKMGTSMESIQNAYMGFSKQNYAMLDNLKLGYGGTKKEMERLLKDAMKISGKKYNLNNLADVYEAIHVIQTELGITGTTAKEAEGTISGSIGMMKASWKNLLTAMGDPNADIGKRIDEFAGSLKTVAKNLFPVFKRVVGNLWNSLTDTVSKLPGLVFGRTEDGEVAWPNWKQIGEKAAELWDKFCNFVAKFTGLEFARDSEGKVKLPSVADVVKKAVERYKEIRKAISDAIAKIGEIVFEIGSGITETTGFDVVQRFGQFIMDNGDTLLNTLELIGSQLALFKITSLAVSGIGTLQTFFQTLSTLNLASVAGNITTIGNGLPAILNKIPFLSVLLWMAIPALIEISRNMDKIKKGWEIFKDTATNAIDSVKAKVTEIKDSIVKAVDEAWQRMETFVKDLASGKLFKDVSESTRNGIAKFFNDTFGWNIPMFDMNGDGVTVDMSGVTDEASKASDAIELASLDLDNLDGKTANATVNVAVKTPSMWDMIQAVLNGGDSGAPTSTPSTSQDFANRHRHNAKGLWDVPYNGYVSALHRGEMVLNASRAREYREGYGNGIDMRQLGDVVREAITSGMDGVSVNSYLSGRRVTDDVNRNTIRQLKAGRFRP